MKVTSGRPGDGGKKVAANQSVLTITRPGPTCHRSRAAARVNWAVRHA